MSEHCVQWSVERADLGPQPPFGARITRLTSAPAISDNIYGEQPRCTADGKRLAFSRRIPGHDAELWIADLERGRIGRIEGVSDRSATPKYSGKLYYVRRDAKTACLTRLDLATLDECRVCDVSDLPPLVSSCISHDERWCFGMRNRGPHLYDIIRVDLHDGSWQSIYADPDICNPHLQTCPGSGDLLVQHNRGCEFDPNGQMRRLVGDQGATLFVIAADGSNYRQIPVGTPYSEFPATGHECWVGNSGWVAYTDSRPADAALRHGNFLAARPGDDAAVPITTGFRFNHISVSKCGRFFVGDATNLEGIPLVIGSMQTGRSVILCRSETTPGAPQWIHTHPYFLSDNSALIFNSDRSGVPQIYAAAIPAGLLDGLDDTAGIRP